MARLEEDFPNRDDGLKVEKHCDYTESHLDSRECFEI